MDGSENQFIREPMVRWYDPRQLLRTALEVSVSHWFGRHSDSRRIDALIHKPQILDFTDPRYLDDDGCAGFDYVADTGDGFDSTYSVAWLLSQPKWPIDSDSASDVDGHPATTDLYRNKLLIFGGDQVYPYPTSQQYRNRLTQPYELAGARWLADDQDNLGDVLAIPGNHDWYDSLVSFRKLFCCGAPAGLRNTRQRHSYFAAKLAYDWWVFGADTQLDGDLDEAQFSFLHDVVAQLGSEDRVVLCLADPGWLDNWKYGAKQAQPLPGRHGRIFTREDCVMDCAIDQAGGQLLGQLIRELGDRLRIVVASDEHCYRRDADKENHQLVAFGMGGAFLHPTHAFADDPNGQFEHKCSYPDPEQSRQLNTGNLGFLFKNPRFGVLAAVAYLAASWSNGLAAGECFGDVCVQQLGELGLGQWREAFVAAFHSLLLNPIGALVYAAIFAGFIFFSDRPRTAQTLALGSAHAIAHIVAGFLIYWGATYFAVSGLDLVPKSIEQMLVTGIAIFTLAWIVGSMLFGLYLYLSLSVFGLHMNEAFSALRIADYKGFLRFKVRADRQLDMWCIGIDSVPNEWSTQRNEHNGVFVDPVNKRGASGRIVDHVSISAQTTR